MPSKVGSKGQVVIEKRIREALGIETGAVAVQRLIGDRVEILFLPAPHRRSLRGCLRPHVRRWPEGDLDDTEDEWVAGAS